MKKILMMFLFLTAALLPVFAGNCDKYSQYSPKQKLLFYIQDNNAECVKEILDFASDKEDLLYWTTDDMCVDCLFYWVHRGKQKVFEDVTDTLISSGADMTRLFCRKTNAIAAAALLAIKDINEKGYYYEYSDPIKRFSYMLKVGSKMDAVNKINDGLKDKKLTDKELADKELIDKGFLQYAINKTGNITSDFIALLLEYGINVKKEDVDYACNNGYDVICKILSNSNPQ